MGRKTTTRSVLAFIPTEDITDNTDILAPENAYNHTLKRRWRHLPFVGMRQVDPDEFQAAWEAMHEVDVEIDQRRRRLEARAFLENL